MRTTTSSTPASGKRYKKEFFLFAIKIKQRRGRCEEEKEGEKWSKKYRKKALWRNKIQEGKRENMKLTITKE